MTVLAVRGVDKAYGERKVLTAVDLTVGAGEIVALMGRSGSGKTTLLTIVAGFESPDAGSVTVDGDADRWHDLAILPQSLGLLSELTVAENVELPLRLGDRTDGDAEGLMARLGIAHIADRHPGECSLGEQQRTALARAAVVRPRLLVADEPVSHQNRAFGEVMMGVLADLAADGTACLLATHDEVAVDAADRVLELRDGLVVA